MLHIFIKKENVTMVDTYFVCKLSGEFRFENFSLSSGINGSNHGKNDCCTDSSHKHFPLLFDY